MAKSDVMCFERGVLKSKAFQELTGKAVHMLFIFLSMRQLTRKPRARKGRRESWQITNNGKIVFPYRDGEEYGITPDQFRRGLDQLIDKGFIDVSHQGGGLLGDVSKYAICERWRKYGTDSFLNRPRQRRCPQVGYQKKHKPKTGMVQL